MREILNNMPGFLDKQPAVIAHRENEKRRKQQEEERIRMFGRKENPNTDPTPDPDEYVAQVSGYSTYQKPMGYVAYADGTIPTAEELAQRRNTSASYYPSQEEEEGEVPGDETIVSPGAEATASAASEARPRTRSVAKQMKATEMKDSGIFRSSKTFPPGAKCTTNSRIPQREVPTPVVQQSSTRKRTVEEVYGEDPLSRNPPRDNPNYQMSVDYLQVEDGKTVNGRSILVNISIYNLYDTSGVLKYHRHDDDRIIMLRFLWWMEVRGRDIRNSQTIGAIRSWSTFLYYYNQGSGPFKERMAKIHERARKSKYGQKAHFANLVPPMKELGPGMEFFRIGSIPYPRDWREIQAKRASSPEHVTTRGNEEEKVSPQQKRSQPQRERVEDTSYDSDGYSPSTPISTSNTSAASSPERTGSPDQERPRLGLPAVPTLVRGTPPTSPRTHPSPCASASLASAQPRIVRSRGNQREEGEVDDLMEKYLDLKALIECHEKQVDASFVKRSELDDYEFVPLHRLQNDYVSLAHHKQEMNKLQAQIENLTGQLQNQNETIRYLESLLKNHSLVLASLQDKVSDDQRKRSDEASS